MGRHSRIVSCTGFYHVYNRGIDQKLIFKTSQQKYFFMRCIRDALTRYKVLILSYCIMDNHMHILLSGELHDISNFMQFIESRYGTTFNYCNNRSGHVFQNTFKSKPIMNESYLWGLMRYIHLNPVKAGLCKDAKHYRFSSMFDYMNNNRQKSLLSNHAISSIQNNYPNIQNFLRFHEKDDRRLYDDIQEDMEMQESYLNQLALVYMNTHYHIDRWEDVKKEPLYRGQIIYVLYHQFHLSIPRIVELLGISRYLVKQAVANR